MILKSHSSVCVQDLRDRLWDICDARRGEAEQECLDIINESWLQDVIGIAMNHFFSLMQVRAAGQDDTDFSPRPRLSCNHSSGNVRGLFYSQHSAQPELQLAKEVS